MEEKIREFMDSIDHGILAFQDGEDQVVTVKGKGSDIVYLLAQIIRQTCEETGMPIVKMLKLISTTAMMIDVLKEGEE